MDDMRDPIVCEGSVEGVKIGDVALHKLHVVERFVVHDKLQTMQTGPQIVSPDRYALIDQPLDCPRANTAQCARYQKSLVSVSRSLHAEVILSGRDSPTRGGSRRCRVITTLPMSHQLVYKSTTHARIHVEDRRRHHDAPLVRRFAIYAPPCPN